MEKMKIVGLELENVKRVSVLNMAMEPTGLTVIGGNNGQGKTTILDAICYALGGERYRPSNLQREGSIADAYIKLTLSNGLTVERTGKNASLKVTDPAGKKGGQALLDSFCEELAINLPKFMDASSKDKAKTLLKIIGIGDQLEIIEREERQAYQERENYYKIADQKNKFYKELPWHDGVPESPMAAAELIQESQAILLRNAEKQSARRNVEQLKIAVDKKEQEYSLAHKKAKELEQEFYAASATYQDLINEISSLTPDESTAEIEKKLTELEEINSKVRANLDKQKAKDDADECTIKYNRLTVQVEDIRKRRLALLDGATMPLPGLSIEDSELTLNGKKWDCMSSAEQLKASAAIVKALKPECGFILLDKLEAMDMTTLAEFRAWLEAEGLQAIATRVSTGAECTIVIEDGRIKETENTEPINNNVPEFVPGVF
jgi:DNA repair exonuclease SbcCD ATPase subunit